MTLFKHVFRASATVPLILAACKGAGTEREIPVFFNESPCKVVTTEEEYTSKRFPYGWVHITDTFFDCPPDENSVPAIKITSRRLIGNILESEVSKYTETYPQCLLRHESLSTMKLVSIECFPTK
ncbi:MAG: hypothetical protein US62_C0044G0008 [Candidatus Woesebacteria bacterium GW2011_GWA1_37_8]|uniref:Lipoprotein n=2 Tax=Candidatus Woeseibacteriota TaxID=1752722 RepID=A0A0G0LGE4_9BACT|nr:MAG: hypothetical protein US39_C0016G0030 [Microgenomates group bacterium GW2011_GWC1_37_12b]KKQ43680.1 MAG: hypothetical protein US62_C0044G0008 [Candidatus Woesebacteria bacterium GW2011_GWA1_37_8]KKQ87015.1 MAG: hypothetical protein UT10_C0012G0003 [Candidatus Woesebacteria bacterium GW2011_GWB1_38_8b]